MSELLVGRQPIFNRRLGVFAYELLFRGAGIDPEQPEAGDLATSTVIVNTFTEIGLENIVSDKRAFLNLTRPFITGEHALPVSPKNVVLEVLESVPPDEEVLRGLERLRKVGFTIALDDFVLGEETHAFMEFADIIKVDVLGKSIEEIEEEVRALRPFGVKLLAEKVETREEFEAYKRMGFSYFQGFFLERPSEVRRKTIHPDQMTLLALLHELHSPAFNYESAEKIVEQDVGLCYRLLRYINSAAFGMPRRIESIGETLIYLGVENVQKLTSLFLLSANTSTPSELLKGAMLRARMCETLGKERNALEARQYFIVGLFSVLDALMQVPMDDLLLKLPLSEDQKLALTEGAGDMGAALATVVAFEHGDWDNVGCFDLPEARIQELYLEAVRWAEVVGDENAPSKAA